MLSNPYSMIRPFFRGFTWPDAVMVVRLRAIIFFVAAIAVTLLARNAFALPLSVADRVNVNIHDGADFSGKYQINLDGAIELPYAGAIAVAGHEPAHAAQIIADALSAGGFFRPELVRVSVQVLELAPVEVSVEGAVFYPGRYRVNQPPPRNRAPDRAEELPGARLSERYLSDALRAAGGVRPNANISSIELIRNGRSRHVDLSGMLDGATVDDVALIADDRIIVHDTGQADPRLARPSRITPPGIKVFVSNLTVPANDNNASTVSKGTISLPYGSRLSQAMVASNCTGGTATTNSARQVVLVRTDRLSGRNTLVDIDAESLLAKGDGATNPILLEGDSITCYDSAVTNLRDIFRTIADIVFPFRLIKVLP